MGSPLSPVLANIYMEWFEKNKIAPILGNDVLWLRYIDDVFSLIPKNTNINNLYNNLNELSDCIKFTMEIESNNKLPFLDIQVIRSNINKPKFNVYRKPTHTEGYIHSYSKHSNKIKKGVLLGLYLRALNICDQEFLNEEINHI